jgi:hypothetical protein
MKVIFFRRVEDHQEVVCWIMSLTDYLRPIKRDTAGRSMRVPNSEEILHRLVAILGDQAAAAVDQHLPASAAKSSAIRHHGFF